MEHCCKEMQFFLEEEKISIGYSSRFRSYYINLKGSGAVQRIIYCPWCGKLLPKPLDNEYDLELSKLLNVPLDDITLDTYYSKSLPKEFKTEEWWKKRGL
jgi:hypothetical protein